jgi:hypothetical protein
MVAIVFLSVEDSNNTLQVAIYSRKVLNTSLQSSHQRDVLSEIAENVKKLRVECKVSTTSRWKTVRVSNTGIQVSEFSPVLLESKRKEGSPVEAWYCIASTRMDLSDRNTFGGAAAEPCWTKADHDNQVC